MVRTWKGILGEGNSLGATSMPGQHGKQRVVFSEGWDVGVKLQAWSGEEWSPGCHHPEGGVRVLGAPAGRGGFLCTLLWRRPQPGDRMPLLPFLGPHWPGRGRKVKQTRTRQK